MPILNSDKETLSKSVYTRSALKLVHQLSRSIIVSLSLSKSVYTRSALKLVCQLSRSIIVSLSLSLSQCILGQLLSWFASCREVSLSLSLFPFATGTFRVTLYNVRNYYYYLIVTKKNTHYARRAASPRAAREGARPTGVSLSPHNDSGYLTNL
jgi:hypothetical protein